MVNRKYSLGFTLIELVVVIGILGILMSVALLAINPGAQIDKANDAKRKSDLSQIRTALDLYYDDNHCYPSSVPFGSEWVVGKTVYMKKVPQDSSCAAVPGYCYVYQANIASTSCSQWNVLYAKLSAKLTSKQLQLSCPTKAVCKTLNSRYNYCIISGNIDCQYVIANPPTPPAPIPTPTPTPTPTPPSGNPTPPPDACLCSTAIHGISDQRCNNVDSNFNLQKYCDSNCTVPCRNN